MAATIHPLTNAHLGIGEPIPSIVEFLEDLVERARAGSIIGIGTFFIDGANSVVTNWASGTASSSLMLAGASRLQYRILSADKNDGA